MTHTKEQILILKHGALGDIVLASGHFKAIRAHHPNAHITCLTRRVWASLIAACPWVDEVWIDKTPRITNLRGSVGLMRALRSRHFTHVYDLQTSSRSSLYWWVMRRPVRWSGIGRFVSHPQRGEARHTMHTIARLNDQLAIAGIQTDGMPDISWLKGDTPVAATSPYALLVPGGSAHRPEKRWPAAHYAALARMLVAQGITPVLIGAGAEAELLDAIGAEAPGALNLCNQTSFGQIADLARGAVWAAGNDTGPIHLIAATGCATTVIFSHASNPEKSAPVGPHVTVLREKDLAALSVERVWATAPTR